MHWSSLLRSCASHPSDFALDFDSFDCRFFNFLRLERNFGILVQVTKIGIPKSALKQLLVGAMSPKKTEVNSKPNQKLPFLSIPGKLGIFGMLCGLGCTA